MTLPDATALRGWVSCPRCGDAVRVIAKKTDHWLERGLKLVWYPSRCRHCKAPLHLAEDFDLATFTAEEE